MPLIKASLGFRTQMCLSLHTLLEACTEVSTYLRCHHTGILYQFLNYLVDILLFVLGLGLDVSHRAACLPVA